MKSSFADSVLADVGSFTWLHWLGVGLSLGIIAVNLTLAVQEAAMPFVLVAGSFLVGVLVFLTRFWRSVLYLLALVHITVLFVLWALDGFPHRTLGLLNGTLSIGLALIALYLFVQTEAGNTDGGNRQ